HTHLNPPPARRIERHRMGPCRKESAGETACILQLAGPAKQHYSACLPCRRFLICQPGIPQENLCQSAKSVDIFFFPSLLFACRASLDTDEVLSTDFAD